MDEKEKLTIQRPGLILAAAAMGAFLATFNETFFNVALVPIMNDLSVSASTAQWLVTANMLVAAVCVPIAGFLYRMMSTRTLYLLATGSLILGSLVGYLAPNFTVLLIARIIQAVGAGMVPVVCMNMTLAVAPKGRIGSYIGIVGAMTTLGPSTSPLVSGIVLTFASWHMLFVVYGVLVLICFIFGFVTVKPVAEITKPKLDIASTVLVSVGLIGVMYGISTIFDGSIAVALVAMVIGIVAFVLFVRRQNRIDNPLIDLRPFKSKAFTVGVLCVIMSLMSVFSMNIIMPTFMQESLGFTALSASITLFPAVMCACIFSPIAGRCYDRWGIRRLAPTGMAVLLVFEIALVLFVKATGVDAPAIWLAVLYAPVIAGAQFVIGPSQSFGLSSLPRQLNTHGVTILSTCFQIAGCVGSSLFMGVYAAGESASLAAGTAEALASLDGFVWACMVAIVVAVLGVIFGLVAAYLERSGKAAPAPEAVPAEEEGSLRQGLSAASIDDVMKRDAYVVTNDQSVHDALFIMAENHTSGLPVVDAAGKPVGFIDAGDIVRYITGETGETPTYALYAIWNDDANYRKKMDTLREVSVMELATTHVIAVEYNEGLEAVTRVLSRHSIKKLPILKDGVLIGVVSRSDLLRFFVREAGK